MRRYGWIGHATMTILCLVLLFAVSFGLGASFLNAAWIAVMGSSLVLWARGRYLAGPSYRFSSPRLRLAMAGVLVAAMALAWARWGTDGLAAAALALSLIAIPVSAYMLDSDSGWSQGS